MNNDNKLCARCNTLKPTSDFYQKESKCKTCVCEIRKEHRLSNLDNIKAKKQEYYLENKEHIINKSKIWTKENQSKKRKNHSNHYHRTKNIPHIAITHRLRARLRAAVKNSDGVKKYNTMEYVGCDIHHLKKHLQQTAISNGYLDFNINNYSGKDYHIDHIIPCNYFNLENEEDQIKCFHYSNLQILTSFENLSKKDKYEA